MESGVSILTIEDFKNFFVPENAVAITPFILIEVLFWGYIPMKDEM